MNKESDITPEIRALIEKWKTDPEHQELAKRWNLRQQIYNLRQTFHEKENDREDCTDPDE